MAKLNRLLHPCFLSVHLTQVTQLIFDLRENYGIFCSVVIYPVVPKDVVMLRLIPTATHSLEDVEYTVKAFKELKRKIDNDKYPARNSGFFKIIS